MQVNKGDIFKVGVHIIACGDSCDRDFVKKVIGINKVTSVLTDPPYGVAYVENKKDLVKIKSDKIIENDHIQSEEEYEEFTRKWIGAVIPYLTEYNSFHIFNSDSMFLALRTAMQKSGIHFSQMLVWIKNQPVMGMKDYLSQFEVIAYGWFGKHKFQRSKAKSVINHPKPKKSGLHPTQKPVGLLRKLILDITKIGDIVYDPFLGSGTTLIACEKLHRICIGFEMDLEYGKFILDRWCPLPQ
jgi:site-specific DNA-methyltransferase (adenine-specific)